MPLNHLQHFFVQSEDVEATKDWFVDVLGLRVGYTPNFKFPVCWLYLGEQDVLHLTQGGKNVSGSRLNYVRQQSQASQGTGVIDHVAFHATGLDEMIEHLRRKNVEFKERQVDTQGLYQLFLLDSNGIIVELNYPNAEAKGRTLGSMGSDLAHGSAGT